MDAEQQHRSVERALRARATAAQISRGAIAPVDALRSERSKKSRESASPLGREGVNASLGKRRASGMTAFEEILREAALAGSKGATRRELADRTGFDLERFVKGAVISMYRAGFLIRNPEHFSYQGTFGSRPRAVRYCYCLSHKGRAKLIRLAQRLEREGLIAA